METAAPAVNGTVLDVITQLAIGSLVISLTLVIEVLFFVVATRTLRRAGDWLGRPPLGLKMGVSLIGLTMWLLAAVSLATWAWALVFLWSGQFDRTEPALYFAIVVITTLGFGDITLEEPWRLLSGLCATNGLFLFGLSTAFLVEFVRRLMQAQDRRT